MKRSKLYFAVTIFSVAIAATAATKANQRPFATGYTQDASTGFCTVSSGIDCAGGNTLCKNGTVQLYEFNSGAACSIALKKQ